MERVLQVINQMKADGVVENYAIGGGIAAVYYIEPYQTDRDRHLYTGFWRQLRRVRFTLYIRISPSSVTRRSKKAC